ncbi:5-formyltetrahydrofolate cyclo-ligase [Methanofollis fontis]|uniref:5-formyltetrahydrofolate cyclo-ligase n=2 Tax=Methanofollis fontis TaxID=2052832 RepID=A0A483CVK3_9EURY|nr:5-formyltetrahydrofolate cyclo-ligase [Methanofollis fontis]
MNTPPPSGATRKQELREEAKRRRFTLSTEEIREMSRAIHRLLLPLLRDARTVMLYVSKPPEVETDALIDALLADGTDVVVPIIEQETRSLRLSYLRDRSALVESTFHVPEPIGSEIPARREAIDCIIVPLVGFDHSGNRLGYGAGYYDRFLAGAGGVPVIGLAFSCQEMVSVPCEPFDRKMDHIVTEREIITCTRAEG